MKVAILHLSDVHLREPYTAVQERNGKIVDAVAPQLQDVRACVVALTGDIAFAGTAEQYSEADTFLTLLIDRLRGVGGGNRSDSFPVHVALCPGNHDCDFSTTLAARDKIVESLQQKRQPISRDIAATCTEVQQNFMDFLRAKADPGAEQQNPLIWEYRFSIGGKTLAVRSCNTAWLSRIREMPGSLYFPVDYIKASQVKADVAVAMFHHPYSWFAPENARSFRDRIEATSDIVLTGHEHIASSRSVAALGGETNLYIEGGVLNESDDSEKSTFNLLLIDLEKSKQQLSQYSWDAAAGHYARINQGDWEEYLVNRLRSNANFIVSPEFERFLDDPGVSLNHPAKAQVRLSDIYVPPDLREVVSLAKRSPLQLSGESLVTYAQKRGRLLLTGAEKSGKSCLAKFLFRRFHAKGYVPVLLDGNKATLKEPQKVEDELISHFTAQYGGNRREAYRQLSPQRRAIILDDFHAVRLGRHTLDALLKELAQRAGIVVLLSSDIAQQVGEIVGLAPASEGRIAFPHFRLQQFGYLRRHELAEKWFALGDVLSDDALVRRLNQAKDVMATAIGKNFVPSFPIFILPLLQALHHNQQVDLGDSTYGYFYELLVRRDLAKNASIASFDVKLSYMTFLAQQLFAAGKKDASERELLDIHTRFQEKSGLDDLKFTAIMAILQECNMLEERDGRYFFKYPYIYYYFVASYLRANVERDESARALVSTLTQRLHEEDSANIILFLVHLSKSDFIISEILKHAVKHFSDVPPATLVPEDTPLGDLEETAKTVFIELPPGQLRRRRLEALERFDAAQKAAEDAELEQANEYLARLGTAFRSLQILGQMLKNFPASLDRSPKMQITEACYGIALRTLGFVFGLLSSNTKGLVQSCIETLIANNPDLSDAELSRRAQESLRALATLATYGTVRRLSVAIGAPFLGPIYDAVERKIDTPIAALVGNSLRLDQSSTFPEQSLLSLARELRESKNFLAYRVLVALVLNHFYVFNPRYDLKERVCKALSIEYKPQLADVAVRLLPKSTRE